MLKIVKTSLLLAVIATSANSSDILATVNGVNITKQDADAFVSIASPDTVFSQLNVKDKMIVTDRLIERALFSELAIKDGIDKSQDFINNMAKIKDELLINIWMKNQMTNTLVSDSEAHEFYKANIATYTHKDTVHAKHILTANSSKAADIIAELQTLTGEALKNKFTELAKLKSEGPSGPNGGDLGEFSKGSMVPEFSQVVWSLNVGEISKSPVKTDFGYHVIYLEGKKKGEAKEYATVKEEIIDTLKQKQFTAKLKEIAKELKSKAKIVNMIEDNNETK